MNMDNENNNQEYQYENTNSNELEESVQENAQDSAEVQQESNVNFVMYNSEPEKTEVPVESSQDVKEVTEEEQQSEQTTSNHQNTSENITYNYSYVNPTPPEEKKKKAKLSKGCKKWILCVSMAIVFGVVASAVFQTGNLIVQKITGTEDTPNKSVSTTVTKDNASNKELTDVAKVASDVMPSVVSITNLSVQEVQSWFGGVTTQEYESTGSGIIVGQNDTELLIVSNNHVVEGSTTLTVSFVDENSVEAVIKGTDANLDLAIIAVPLDKISSETLDAIKIATLGDSDTLSVGEPAIAIGNALGYGQSVTCGIISALERQIDGFDASLIQTDAAINPGNSGGALLNASGEVIGINTVKVSADAVEGMGYAIPISDVNDIINELMNRETRTKVDEAKRGTIGIEGVDVSETDSQRYNMPEGVYVYGIIKGGAADKAGIPKSCIIVKFGGTSVKSMEQLQEQLAYYKAGEKVELVVMIPDGNGEYVEKTYEIKLGEQSIFN